MYKTQTFRGRGINEKTFIPYTLDISTHFYILLMATFPFTKRWCVHFLKEVWESVGLVHSFKYLQLRTEPNFYSELNSKKKWWSFTNVCVTLNLHELIWIKLLLSLGITDTSILLKTKCIIMRSASSACIEADACMNKDFEYRSFIWQVIWHILGHRL